VWIVRESESPQECSQPGASSIQPRPCLTRPFPARARAHRRPQRSGDRTPRSRRRARRLHLWRLAALANALGLPLTALFVSATSQRAATDDDVRVEAALLSARAAKNSHTASTGRTSGPNTPYAPGANASTAPAPSSTETATAGRSRHAKASSTARPSKSWLRHNARDAVYDLTRRACSGQSPTNRATSQPSASPPAARESYSQNSCAQG
jgi:hypothetical protein